ncbi:hypothetical protein ACH4KO_16870 [Streptomyces anulatus]
MTLMLKVAGAEGYAAAISTVSIAEVRRTGQVANRMRRHRSRLTVIPATEIIAARAAKLLEDAGLDVHETSRPRSWSPRRHRSLSGGSSYG